MSALAIRHLITARTERPITGALHWYAAQTRSNFERVIAAELTAKGIETLHPAVREVHRWKDRMKAVDTPIFPGYIFVRIEDTAPERIRVLNTNGLVRILRDRTAIEPIPDHEIHAIRKLMSSAQPFVAHPFIKEGALVCVKRGTMRGVMGRIVRFKNGTRLVLSVELLHRAVAVEIDGYDVEPAGSLSQLS